MRKIGLVGIIDDDKTFQYTIKKTIESTNSVEQIIQFADGAEAVEYFVEHKDDPDKIPDLILLDLNMPYMDGWQFLEEISNHQFKKKNFTIYICTTSNISHDREKILSYSKLQGYLVKPLLRANMFTLLDLQLSY